MTRVEVNKIVEETNRKLSVAGKMFRLKAVNLVEAECAHCDDTVVVEQNSPEVPVCLECKAELHQDYWAHEEEY